MGRLFGTDGIRGVVDKELTPALTKRVGKALSRILKEESDTPRVLVGMDTRESSNGLSSAIMEGIMEGGGVARSIGVCSTPAIAYLLTRGGYDAGVMISASHNPYEFNGIKIFGRGGYKLSDSMEDKIEELINEPSEKAAQGEYVEYLRSSFNTSLNGIKIGIDCANGSASYTAEELFSSLGAECYMINHTPNGKNINDRCGSTHLEAIKALVVGNGLDIGFAFDGDADRCIAIDEKGQVIDGDYIIAIISLMLKAEGRLKGNTVVGTVMSNLGLRKFCAENKIDFKCSAVGDRYVLEMLSEGGYSLGGEQSGHIIFPDIATTGDGQLTALALLAAMKRSGKRLSTLAEVMKKYPQININIDADCKDKEWLRSDGVIKEIINDAEGKLRDSGRIVVRPSGTEPLIRISVEAATVSEAKKICHCLEAKIKGRLNELKTSYR